MKNKTFRLFVSSTFDDFVAERDAINNVVFPQIKSYCRGFGYDFQIVDLRWGINIESSLNQKALPICIDEVKKCRELSPRPNFLLMVGERYGWIPLAYIIPNKDFSELLSVCSQEERALASQWYELDENDVNKGYFLRGRSGETENDEVWSRVESRLRNALISAADRVDNTSPRFDYLRASATRHEITEGFLKQTSPCNNVVAFLRSASEWKDNDTSAVDKLRSDIVEKMTSDGCSENICTLECGDGYIEKFCSSIIAMLKRNISSEIEAFEGALEEINQEELSLNALTDKKIFARNDEADKISRYVSGNERGIMLVSGESGSGKTTLLADFIRKCDRDCVFSIYGASDNSYTLFDAIRNICAKINDLYGLSLNTQLNSFNISEVFYEYITSVPKDRELVIVIDGLDMFLDIEDFRENIFPAELPENVKIIVSYALPEVVERFTGSDKCVSLSIGKISAENAKELVFEGLRDRGREIASGVQEGLINKAISNGATPLQIKLICEYCSRWHSSYVPDCLPEKSEEIALKYINSMYEALGHNREFILNALALIAASPLGITEDELLSLLSDINSVKAYLKEEYSYFASSKAEQIPFSIWSRLFYDLKDCLNISLSDGEPVIKFEHNVFYRVFTENYCEYCKAAGERLISYYESAPNYLSKDIINRRKILSLFALLADNSIGRLAASLKNLHFVDCAVKTIDFYRLTDVLTRAVNTGNDEDGSLLNTLRCILNNRATLECYPAEFLRCCLKEGFNVDCTTDIYADRLSYYNGDIISLYGYSDNAKIYWNDNKNMFAVVNNNTVHICNENGNELCKHFCNVKEIEELIWLGDFGFALRTAVSSKLYDRYSASIFKIQNNGISFVKQLDILHSDFIALKSANVVLFLDEDHINAYDYVNDRYVYQAEDSFRIENVKLRANEQQQTLHIYGGYGKCYVHNLSDGSLISKNASDSDCAEYDFVKLNNGTTVFYSNKKKAYFFKSGSGINYINPPAPELINNIVFGNSLMMVIYDRCILAVSLYDFSVYSLKIENARAFSWIETDRTFSVASNKIMYRIELSSFAACDFKCAVTPVNEFNEQTKQDRRIRKKASPFNRNLETLLSYKNYFGAAGSAYLPYATMIAVSKSGVKAIAYETEDTVSIFDKDNNLLFELDNLKLNLMNNLLKMGFSDDSRYFYLWRNTDINVIIVSTGSLLFKLDLRKRLLLDAHFNGDSSKLCLRFTDGKEYCVDMRNYARSILSIPRRAYFYNKLVPFFVLYKQVKEGNNYLPYVITEADKYESFASDNCFCEKTYYSNEACQLKFENGKFYNCTDGKDVEISSVNFDFARSYAIEKSRDESALKRFFREKNDITSELLCCEDNCAVLICKRLNSVIMFNLESNEVINALKFNNSIIGAEVSGDSVIRILHDKRPLVTTIHLGKKIRQ